MSNLLRLRKRARNVDVPINNLLEVPNKENLTMALFSCTYNEYEEWRMTRLRSYFPVSYGTREFLEQYQMYMEKVMEVSHTLKILENHFSFIRPESFQPLSMASTRLLFEEYVSKHVVRLLYEVSDFLFEYRKNKNPALLLPVRDLLLVLYSWYHTEEDEMWLTSLWQNVFLLSYRRQRYSVSGSEAFEAPLQVVESHLQTELDLCRFLPGCGSFYFDILEDTVTGCTFPLVFPALLDARNVFQGMVMYRSTCLLHAWQLYISACWQKKPWEAVVLVKRFVEECECPDGYNKVSNAVLQSFQQQVQEHVKVLAKTMHKHLSVASFLFLYGGDSLPGLVTAVMEHVWSHREDPVISKDAPRLLEPMEHATEGVTHPLRALLHDLCEIENDENERTDGCLRVFMCRAVIGPPLPQEEMRVEELARWKEKYDRAYRAKYPSRKLQWLDWQSTVEVTCGATMSLVQWRLVRLLERQGPLSIRAMMDHTGWQATYVCGTVHSLLYHKMWPLVERVKNSQEKIREDDVIALRQETFQGKTTYVLPQFSFLQPSCLVKRTLHEQDEKYLLEAIMVNHLKKEGSMSVSVLLQKCQEKVVGVSLERVECVLQGLVDKEYARREEKDFYHYMA